MTDHVLDVCMDASAGVRTDNDDGAISKMQLPICVPPAPAVRVVMPQCSLQTPLVMDGRTVIAPVVIRVDPPSKRLIVRVRAARGVV